VFITKGQIELRVTEQKKSCVIDAAIPNIRNLHSINTEKLQKHTNLKEELNLAYTVPLVR